VFCFKLFRLASEFIRHAEENHKHKNGSKASYMGMTSNELRGRVDNELAKSANLFVEGRSTKRARGATGMDLETSDTETQGIKRIMTMDNSQQINGIDLLQVPWLC
jgi:hypothetical protein